MLAERRVQPEYLRREIFQIDDLRPLLAQDGCEAVMLLLRAVEIRNVVEKELLQRVGA